MPYITEALARDVRRKMKPGVMMERRYWTDADAPHRHLGSFPRADHVLKVVFAADGRASITKRYYDRESSSPRTTVVCWAPDDVVALVETAPLGSSREVTFAHHDDRLYLPNGYLQAHPGTMHRTWTAVHDGTVLADGVTVLEGRKILAALSV